MGNLPLTVQFTDKSKGAVSWQWQFGDGSSSIEKSPAHTFSKAGIYAVTLTAGNADNEYSCRSGIVVVLDPREKLSGKDLVSIRDLERSANADENQ